MTEVGMEQRHEKGWTTNKEKRYTLAVGGRGNHFTDFD